MTEATYVVDGMTCSHCVNAVTEEVEQLAGVQDVRVDLASGVLTVASAAELAESDVRGAVEEAGYTLKAS